MSCRSDVAVPASYHHGDHVKCGSCGTGHKVSRGDVLRLVIADVAPLREALHANQTMQSRLEGELRTARGSFGVGVNGLGVGLIFALWQIVQAERTIDAALAWEAAGVAVLSGILLEAANFLFLAKRQRMRRLATEIHEARAEARSLQQKIREAGRV
ncbi:MAG TPA: hypothetical protein VMR21_12695 [Vicinamibacteria bacterium]|nr:hypothetical protein [Vicinamibacteria bacterium]